MRPLDISDSLTVSDGSSVPYAKPPTLVEPAPSMSEKEARFWPSSPRDQEGERPESLSSVEEERDDSFTSVIDLIRRYHNLEKPAGVIPSRGLTTLAQTLSLQAEASPASEPKKRPVVIPHTLVSSFETALSGMGEVISWLDWWLSTLSKFGESLPDEARSNFQRLMVSGAKSLEFLGSQTTPVLANVVLLRRDFLVSEVRSTVPQRNSRGYATPRCLLLWHCFPRHSWTRPSVRHAPRPQGASPSKDPEAPTARPKQVVIFSSHTGGSVRGLAPRSPSTTDVAWQLLYCLLVRRQSQ